MAVEWEQDASDYSWHAKDADGVFYRLTRVHCEDSTWRWVLAWQETQGLRISSYAGDNLAAMKQRAESIMSMADAA